MIVHDLATAAQNILVGALAWTAAGSAALALSIVLIAGAITGMWRKS
ncbi:hypothetical protein V2W30_22540 [Streptomyces sp. Q6]|uniref:Uncharacterized protein n=1 Tax=Streptomyces citrinus TaxID=3118173 RepID=A0ACD5AF59_9ACTN